MESKDPVRGLDRAQRFKKGDGAPSELRPGASGAHAQGGNGRFRTIFRATAAARESNHQYKKTYPRYMTYLSNALLIDRWGG